jgi:hypothetical protein
MLRDDIQILVVATHHRRPLILENEEFEQTLHTMCWTTDYDLPKDFKPRSDFCGLVVNHTGFMRNFKGHQDALKQLIKPIALVLEDDTGFAMPDWKIVVNRAAEHLGEFEVVSLHGREWFQSDFSPRPLYGPCQLQAAKKSSGIWCVGALAYLIRQADTALFLDLPYEGQPTDVLLHERYKFAVVDPSPFIHDRRQGSLAMSCPQPTLSNA